jgi:hypothetical protein
MVASDAIRLSVSFLLLVLALRSCDAQWWMAQPPPAVARSRAGGIALVALRRHGARYRDQQAAAGYDALRQVQAHLEQHIAALSPLVDLMLNILNVLAYAS